MKSNLHIYKSDGKHLVLVAACQEALAVPNLSLVATVSVPNPGYVCDPLCRRKLSRALVRGCDIVSTLAHDRCRLVI